jgi:hypothetical protein
MDRSNELGTESVLKLLLKFSIPSIIGMLVNVLYSVVDRIFVGRWIGALPLSGVAVTFPITNIIMAFGMLAGIGAAAAISIRLGQNKKHEAERILGNTFILLIIFSLFISLFGLLFLEPILKVLGATPDIMPYAKQFSKVLLIGVLSQNIGFGLNSIIRAQGSPKFAMTTMIIGALVNIVVNPILIFIFKMGVMGSATSTVIAQTVSAVWTLHYFIKGKGLISLKKENMRLDLDICAGRWPGRVRKEKRWHCASRAWPKCPWRSRIRCRGRRPQLLLPIDRAEADCGVKVVKTVHQGGVGRGFGGAEEPGEAWAGGRQAIGAEDADQQPAGGETQEIARAGIGLRTTGNEDADNDQRYPECIGDVEQLCRER